MSILQTSKGTFAAPFCNTEPSNYLVIEDDFPNGRPPLEAAGVIFEANASEVAKYEQMKVGTCLNPLHTTLATVGCLLGYDEIAKEMQDSTMSKLLQAQAMESLPKAVKPRSMNPADFLQDSLCRFANPNIEDSPQRIATDTSLKLAPRYGATIEAYGDTADTLKVLPLAIACWVRYVAGATEVSPGKAVGVADDGSPMFLSADVHLSKIVALASEMVVGEPESASSARVGELLHVAFGDQDLYAVGVGQKVEEYVREMLTGPAAVRTTLNTVLASVRL